MASLTRFVVGNSRLSARFISVAARPRGGRLLAAAWPPTWEALQRSPLAGGSVAAASGSRRRFSSANLDPYKELGVDRNARDADIKKAYREKALKWHPDKNPDKKEEAQRRFAAASSAYDILKDADKRREFDQFGRVGGMGGPQGPNGAGGAPGGFYYQGQQMSQADAERLFQEAFGTQALGQFLESLFQQSQGGGGGQRAIVLQPGMEVRIHSDVSRIHAASRACKIDAANDERRARCAGKTGIITQTDTRDQSVKVRVQIKARAADEVWFGLGAVEPTVQMESQQMQSQFGFGSGGRGGPFMADMGGFAQAPPRPGGCAGARRAAAQEPQPQPQPGPRGLEVGMEVRICDEAAVHAASRKCGISAENDERRARCAGKRGTITNTDLRDGSVKVRVMVVPGRADEVWFGASAVERLPQDPAHIDASFAASSSSSRSRASHA